jgi:uncharacterized membrane protein
MITVSEKGGTMKIKYDSSWLLAWCTDSFKEVLRVGSTRTKLLGATREAFSKVSTVTILSTGYVSPYRIYHGNYSSLVRFAKHEIGNYAVEVVVKHE